VRSEGGGSFAKNIRAIESKLLPQADFQPIRFFLTELNTGKASLAHPAQRGAPDQK